MEPSWHLRLLLVTVERDADGDQSERDQHHGGNVELADERNDFGRRRHGVGNDEHVDSEGEEDGDNKRDAFAIVGGQKEGEGRQERDDRTWDDQVGKIEQRLPSNADVHRYAWVRLGATAVVRNTFGQRRFDHFPLRVLDKTREVSGCRFREEVYFAAVVGPRTKCYFANLFVEREILDVDFAFTF